MQILVLGGTGAMGTYLVDILAERNLEVYVTSRTQRTDKRSNVKYIHGNAQDKSFLDSVLSDHFDAIIDFMSYSTESFAQRYESLLSSTSHYFFLSSCRVYADSEKPITEVSPRLLDVSQDSEFLQTSEYSLAKARQEDILINSDFRNWTIIRPYITYSDNRLQLGVLEKEFWLFRALNGKSIVFSKDIAECKTSLTNGYDVAFAIAGMIGNEKAKGECVHITNPESILWKDVLKIYLDTIEEETGSRPRVFWTETADNIAGILNNPYQIKYDRLFNRSFDSTKATELCGCDFSYIPVEKGLRECLCRFIREKKKMKPVWSFESQMDRLTGEKTSFKELKTAKNIYYYYFSSKSNLCFLKKIFRKK